MENLNLLKAMLLLAENLNYSQTYKMDLIDQIKSMIKQELYNSEN